MPAFLLVIVVINCGFSDKLEIIIKTGNDIALSLALNSNGIVSVGNAQPVPPNLSKMDYESRMFYIASRANSFAKHGTDLTLESK